MTTIRVTEAEKAALGLIYAGPLVPASDEAKEALAGIEELGWAIRQADGAYQITDRGRAVHRGDEGMPRLDPTLHRADLEAPPAPPAEPDPEPDPVWVILAWLETEQHPIEGTGRPDLGRPPEMREVTIAKALTWVADGTELDLEKAREHAAGMTPRATVFAFPKAEMEPLARARREMLGSVAPQLTPRVERPAPVKPKRMTGGAGEAACIEAVRGGARKTAAIAEAMGVGRNAAWGTINRLLKKGVLRRAGRGVYELVE